MFFKLLRSFEQISDSYTVLCLGFKVTLDAKQIVTLRQILVVFLAVNFRKFLKNLNVKAES